MMKRPLMIITLAALFTACNPLEYDNFATISGIVVDVDDQSPIEGATVTLNPSGKYRYTDNNGYFQFLDIDVEPYDILGQKDGYSSYLKRVPTVAGGSENIIIPLKKK